MSPRLFLAEHAGADRRSSSHSQNVSATAIASRMHTANISATTTPGRKIFVDLVQVAPQPNAPLIVLFRGSLAVIVTRKRGAALAPRSRKGSDEAAN